MADKYNLVKVEFSSDKVPNFVEVRGEDWIKYGETNDYPQYLVLLFNRSAKHNAIVTNKQLYIKGQGFVFNPEGINGESQIKLRAFIDNPNPYETLDDLMAKTVLDVELFNGFYLKVTRAKGKNQPPYISHIDYCKVRSDVNNERFFVSDNWITEEGAENSRPDVKEYPVYKEDGKDKESIFYYKAYRPNLDTYTLPDYIGAVPAIITDAEIANFHRAEIQNGFKGSKLIVFKNGVPSDEEMKSVERRMKAKFTSTDNAGVFVIDFVDDVTRVPEILDLSAGDFADKYNALNDTIQQEIFVGHKIISPMLFGVRVEGQLGGRNEMVDAFNLFQNTYVTPRQRVQENVYNFFAPVKGKLKIKPIEPLMPSFSESTLMQLLTKDEMRSIIGREPLETKSNVNTSITDDLNSLSPLVATKVLNNLTKNEVRAIVGKPPVEGGDAIAPETPAAFSACQHFNSQADDKIDFEVFQKYGEPIEMFTSVKHKKFMFTKQDFALTKIEEGVLDLIKKTPSITKESIGKVLKINKTTVENVLETLTAEGLVETSVDGQTLTPKGEKIKTPSFESLFIRYRYSLRPDAPTLIGESRDFCQAMMENPRYFSREDIESIGEELGQIYGIPNYDAFSRRGGFYHDPQRDVTFPFCRHVWSAELVKRK
jgi:DNA-binding MarR family transcriptional regulator